MNRICIIAVLALLSAVYHGSATAQTRLKSGHQAGDKIRDQFECLNVTGKFAGAEHCLVCQHGLDPVAMVFARSVHEPLERLIVKLDAASASHRKDRLGTFVVFLSSDKQLPKRLKELAAKHKLKHTVLATYDPAGPDGFKISRDADVTVVMYQDFMVAANHAFRKGELNDKAGERIIADLPKILPKK